MTEWDEASCADRGGAVPGEYVLLSVSDNGCGMDDKTLDRIFEPFFTTKEMGKGTGLGLATVYGAVKQNNGFIEVRSELGRGTAFNILLPQCRAGPQVNADATMSRPAPHGGETILLVEDEPAILKMVATMLEKLGYSVVGVHTPDEAIRRAGEHAGTIHLLISDVVMPKMNGHDLAEKILASRPDIRCLFMSGYTADVIAHNGVLDQGVNFIQKPFFEKDLAAKVREVLARK